MRPKFHRKRTRFGVTLSRNRCTYLAAIRSATSLGNFPYQLDGIVYARRYPYSHGRNAKTLDRREKKPAA
jgi:hypothetical protein